MDNYVTEQIRHKCQIASRRKRRRCRSTVSIPFAITSAIVYNSCISSFPGVVSFHTIVKNNQQTVQTKSRHLPITSVRSGVFPLAVSITDNVACSYDDIDNDKNYGQSLSYEATSKEILRLRSLLKQQLYNNYFEESLDTVKNVLQILSNDCDSLSKSQLVKLHFEVDVCIQELMNAALAPPYHDYRRVMISIEAMNLQLSSTFLTAPYNTVPRRLLLNTITALTSLLNNDAKNDCYTLQSTRSSYLVLSYRIFQRLISGVGVRGTMSYVPSEKEFSQILQAHCVSGEMVTAERIVKLQERTIKGIPASLVTYSILIKGYGQKMDIQNVESTIQRAKSTNTELDTIMVNTIVDAYINCDAMDKAATTFADIRNGNLPFNRRTYNTFMKGLAKQGALVEAINLANEMKRLKLWDSITTNTLVHASIMSGNFTYAEEILEKHTMRYDTSKHRHPNVEAYTELLDAYAKSNQLDNSLSVLQTMHRRNVEPNEVTYTCLMGGLGRNRRIDLGMKLFAYMETKDQRPTIKIYNALLLGLLNETNAIDLDSRVDEGIKLLHNMKLKHVKPNSVTVSILIDALGRCKNPRVVEAQMLVDELERLGCISRMDKRVSTSLIRLYGKVANIQGVVKSFQRLENPDTVAVNAYMDACCRCRSEKAAFDAFELYFRKTRKPLRPDVVTYAIIIGSVLQRHSAESLERAHILYTDMKTRNIARPDNGLVDVILKSVVRLGSSKQLTKQHLPLIVDVLKDAELLTWEDGQLMRRKRAVQVAIEESFGGSLRPNHSIFSMLPSCNTHDDLFNRKGWNQMKSGFRLWGESYSDAFSEQGKKNHDQFLHSHGWNDVDSNFRII